MRTADDRPLDGGCTCAAVRYRMTSWPLRVHCCHCRWCQRETGASYALNAIIEADRVVVLEGHPEIVDTPSASGKGQRIARCPTCRVALWSNYAGAGDAIRFVRSRRHDHDRDGELHAQVAADLEPILSG